MRYLEHFKDFFTEPGLKHFAEYLTGLILSDNKTVKGINDSFVGHRDQSSKNKFLNDTQWSTSAINKKKNEIMLSCIKKFNPKHGFLILDATIIEKTGNCIEGTGIYFDNSKKRYILGHQLVSSYFITKFKKFQLPVDFRLFIKKQDATKKFKTKIQLAKELIGSAVEEKIPFETVIMDTWYCSKELLKFIEEKGKKWIAGCKSNRLIFIHHKKIQISEYEKILPKENFVKVTLERGGKELTYYYFCKCARISNLGRVKLLISYEEDFDREPILSVLII